MSDTEPAEPLSGSTDPTEPTDGRPEAPAETALVPNFRVTEVSSIAFPLPSPSPVVFLREIDEPYRGLEFPVGLPEAQSIAMAFDGIDPPRPGAHDLLTSILGAVNADVIAVRITYAQGGTFLAELDVMTPQGRVVLDCRPTDGIAVAMRQVPPAPILVEESLLAH